MLAVIANPRSKVHRNDPACVDRLRHVVAGRGEVFAPESRAALDEACTALRQSGVDLVAVHGGDGTLHVTMGALAKVYENGPMPRIAILPAGTLNTVAAGLGLGGEPLERLARVCDDHGRGRVMTTRRPLLRVGHHAGFLFGHGLIANFMRAYYDTGAPSPATGAALLARAALSAAVNGPLARQLFARPRTRVTVDGVVWPHEDHATIACATVPEIGIGFRPFPHVLDREDRFEVVGFHCTPLQLVGLLPRIRAGNDLPPSRATSALASGLVLEADAPFDYVVDGDLYTTEGTSLELAVGPVVELVV
jgi:diacylglycerol kinase (ATP)